MKALNRLSNYVGLFGSALFFFATLNPGFAALCCIFLGNVLYKGE